MHRPSACLDDAQLDAIASSRALPKDMEVALAHAADCGDCADLLAVLAEAKVTIHETETLDGSQAAAPLGPLPGDTIGRFVVQRVAGRGGMGVVVAASDPKLDRTVAIKLLRSGLAEKTLVREARAIATVRHPNVVTIHEVDQDTGRVFLVMDYVEGPTLRGWLSERTSPWPRIVRMFIGAGRGLAAAHQHGLIHRDFKPDNVLVDQNNIPKVIDFGLVSAWRNEHSSLGGTSTLAGGTPRYMAPECHTRAEATFASDQYSFCVAAFEALVGKHPFGAKEGRLRRASIDDIVVPTSAVPSRLIQILTTGLRSDPQRRHPDMGSLLEELESVLRSRRRNRRLFAGGMFAAAATTGALWINSADERARCRSMASGDQLGGVWDSARKEALATTLDSQTWSRVENVVDDYANAWSQLRADLCRNSRTAAVSSFDRQIACLDARRVSLEVTLDIIEAGQAPQTPLEIVYGLQPLQRCLTPGGVAFSRPSASVAGEVARLRQRIAAAAATTRSGLAEEAVIQLEPVLKEAEEIAWMPLVVEVLIELAKAQSLVAPDRAVETWRDAYTVAGSLGDAQLLGELELSGIQHYIKVGELATADFLLSVAKSRTEGRPDGIRFLRASSILNLAHGNLEAAEADYRLILDQTQRSPRYEGDLGEAYGDMGAVLLQQGRVEEAVEFTERAVEETERAYGPRHRQVIRLRQNRAALLRQQGRIAAALEELQSVRQIAGPLERPAVTHMLAVVLRDNGRPLEALPLDQEVVAARKERLGERHPATVESQAAVGLDLVLADRPKDAIDYLSEPSKLVREQPPNRRTLKVLVHLGWAHQDLGDLDGAARVLEEALVRLESIPQAGTEAVRIAHSLGTVLIELEQFDEAIDVLGEAHQSAQELFKASPDAAMPIDIAYNTGFALAKAHLGAGHPERAIELGQQTAALLADVDPEDPRRRKVEEWLVALRPRARAASARERLAPPRGTAGPGPRR